MASGTIVRPAAGFGFGQQALGRLAGDLVGAARQRLGADNADLARVLAQLSDEEVDPREVASWSRGQDLPIGAVSLALLHLATSGDLDHFRPSEPSHPPSEPPKLNAARHSLDNEEVAHLNRRQFLGGLGATAALAAFADVDQLAFVLKRGAIGLDHRFVGQLADTTKMFEWRALQQGHRPLLHLVQAHREWMEGLLGGSMPTGIRARLQSVTSETAILEATLLWYQDKHREVGQCLGTALKMAEESGDRPLGAYALGRVALHGLDPSDRLRLLSEGDCGFRTSDASTTTGAWLAWIQAYAAAATGDAVLAGRHYDRVRGVFATDPVDGDEGRPLTPVYLPTDIPGDWGGILILLGRNREARAELDRALQDLDPENRKQRGWLLIGKAITYLDAHHPEPDEAADIALEALAVASDLGAEPMISALSQLYTKLRPWLDRPAVAELHQRLREG